MASANVKGKTKARVRGKSQRPAAQLRKLATPTRGSTRKQFKNLVDKNAPLTRTTVTQAASPAVTPFLNADQQQQLDEANLNYQGQLNDMDASYARSTADVQYKTAEIERQRVAAATAATNSLIARGLFRSSIRDADLADIEGAAARNRMQLNDSLALQSAANERARSTLAQGINNIQTYMDRNAVENARAVPTTPEETAQTPIVQPKGVPLKRPKPGYRDATELVKLKAPKPIKAARPAVARVKSKPYTSAPSAMGKIRPVA